MAKKKKPAPEQTLQQYREDLMGSMERWADIKINGCNEPAWPDGTNMNLAKNHIIWYRFKIMEICTVHELAYPPEYYLTVPPEVPSGYMASLRQSERVKQLQAMGYCLTTEI